MLVLGNKTGQPDQDGIHYVVGMAGQSQLVAADYYDNLSESAPFFSDRAKIWDKIMRQNYKLPETTDSARSGEAHQFRIYDKSMEGNGASFSYPWEMPVANPIFGPGLAMASNWCSHRKGQFRMVKLAESGSQVFNLPTTPNWNVAATGNNSYLQTFKTAYWDPAMAQTIADAGGKANVRILGFVWMQGFSDARTQEEADAYEANAGALIDNLRQHMKPSDPTSVPVLVIQSPDTDLPVENYLSTVRQGQANLGNRTNVTVIDSEGLPEQPSNLPHFTSDGYKTLGEMIARHFRTLDGVQPD